MTTGTLERPPAAQKRRRKGRVVLLVGTLGAALVAGTGITYLVLSRPPAPVSVPDVIHHYRSAHPTPEPMPSGGLRAPKAGVYVYATTGTESISTGLKHTYPKQTTLTVTNAGCGLRVRWDALEGRWQQWQLCPSGDGWRLASYVDAHKFLYLQDTHRYRCTGDPWSMSSRTVTVSCDTGKSVLTSTARVVGREVLTVGSAAVETVHVHIDQRATGASTSSGSVELWLRASSGLPIREVIHGTGSQVVLGGRITYRESAIFELTSVQPRR